MSQIQIFKPGTVTSMEGVAVSFTDADLRGIADRYDPALHEAPFTVGHPQHDAPAYGWVGGLSFADDVLSANAIQLNEDFVQLHRNGGFKKVSARFYTPSSPNNPTPGQFYLRDVGFLGAMAPAVKGLRTASFADGVDELLTAEISFGDLPGYSGIDISRMFRRIRDWFIAEKGQDVADRVLPDYDIDRLRDTSQRAAAEPTPVSVRPIGSASFADPTIPAAKEAALTTKTQEQLQADLDAANVQLGELRNAETKRAADARHADNASFADSLIAAAKWPAGAKEVLVASLNHLSTPVDSACVSFGDGDAAKPLHEVLREQLTALPPVVSFAEVARKGAGAGSALTDRQMSDRARAHIARVAANGGRSISMGQALDAVRAGTDKE